MQGRFKFCLVADPSRHKAARVESDDHGLVPLDLILPRGKFVPPRCGGPRDVSKLAPANVTAHRFEFTSLASPYRTPLDREERPCTECLELHLPCPPHIRIDLYTLIFTE